MPRRVLRSLLLAAVPLLGAAPLAAQDPHEAPVNGAARAGSMRESLRGVFHLGACEQLICLSEASPGEHGQHYNPAAQQVAEIVVGFLGRAIQTSIVNIPLGATSSGTLFEIGPGGVPVPVAGSTGPVFGERPQTLGRGRFLFGVNATGSSFQSLRGVPLSRLRMTLPHEDQDPPGLGNPVLERDTLVMQSSLEATMAAVSAYLSYGLTNRIDVGVVVPLVRLSIDGTTLGTFYSSTATPLHFFSGTIADPVLTAEARSSASSTGIGDVAVRAKFNLAQSPRAGAAFLTDVRLPTGDEDDLLGSGEMSVRGLLVTAVRVGQMTPHANVGFVWRGGDDENSSLLGIVGFDALAANNLTLAADLLAELQLSDSRLTLPAPIRYLDGSMVRSTNIPVARDHQLSASVGGKYLLARDFLAVANVILPLGDNGMRANVVWTFGLERGF